MVGQNCCIDFALSGLWSKEPVFLYQQVRSLFSHSCSGLTTSFWVCCAFGNACISPHPWYQKSNIKKFSFTGKDQALQIPDITVCHEHPYQSLERIDEMVTSKGYEENTYGLSDLVAYSHRNYSVQTVSFFHKTICLQIIWFISGLLEHFNL